MSERTPLLANSPQGDDSLLANTQGLSHSRMLVLLAAVQFTSFLVALDTTVISTLLAHIASDLKQLDNISWVATGYLIAYSAFQPLYGKLSDIFGRKTILIFCSAMFGVGCQLCGMAHNLQLLVLGRFVSGVGAGGMLSTSTIIISDYIPLRKRGVFQGIGNVVFALGASSGGILGGWITRMSGWRMAFLVQVPLIVLAIIVVGVIVEEKKSDVPVRVAIKRIDFGGAFTLVSGLLLFMFAVTTGGNQFAWGSFTIVGALVGSVVFLVVFFVWEKDYASEPVLPLDVLLNRTVISACFTNFFGSGVAYSLIYYGPVILSSLFNVSYQDLSSRIIANFIGVASGSLSSGVIMRRHGTYKRIGSTVCLLMLASSLVFLAIVLSDPKLGSSAAFQCFAYLIQGFGYAGMLTVTLVALIAAVTPEQQATSTSAQYTFRGAGSSVGIAVSASIFQNVLQSQLAKNIHGKGSAKVIRRVLKSVEAIREQPERFIQPIIDSYRVASIWTLAFCFILAVSATIAFTYVEEHTLEKQVVAETAEIVTEPEV